MFSCVYYLVGRKTGSCFVAYFIRYLRFNEQWPRYTCVGWTCGPIACRSMSAYNGSQTSNTRAIVASSATRSSITFVFRRAVHMPRARALAPFPAWRHAHWARDRSRAAVSTTQALSYLSTISTACVHCDADGDMQSPEAVFISIKVSMLEISILRYRYILSCRNERGKNNTKYSWVAKCLAFSFNILRNYGVYRCTFKPLWVH